MNKFNIGDEIYHKSNPTIKWIIEKIDNNEAFCSTIIKESFEQKKEAFAITSIEKCTSPRIISVKKNRENYY